MSIMLVTFAWILIAITSKGAVSHGENCSEEGNRGLDMIPNNETGLRTAQWSENMNVNPDELGNYFEGDIMAANNIKRNVLTNESTDWRWSNGVIPIVVDGDFGKYLQN